MEHTNFDPGYLARLKSGDPETEKHFIAYFSNVMLLSLRGRVRAAHLIDEIRQETFARVLKYLRSDKKIEHPERFGAFVHGICTNVRLEVLRSESRHPRSSEEAADPPDDRVRIHADMVTEERKQMVREVLAELPEKDRSLLRRVFLDEEDRAAISRQFQIEADYLRVLLHRAKEKFREIARRKGIAGVLHQP